MKITLASALMSMQIEGTDPQGADQFLYMILPVKMS